MDGNYLIYIDEDSRIPDLEVDIFILTDPNDEKSAKMWMNGTGAKQLLQAKPYEQYYAVVDGFKGVTARLSIAVAELTAMATFCSNDNQTIDLNDFLTGVTTVPGDVWSQLTGTGGSLNTTTGIFTSAPGTTTSSFRLIRDCGPTEDVFIGFQDCIPTLNQWGLIIFSILLLITGVLAIRWQSAT
ncbi:MAG: IPTL-CTERM sorting domain-containing protein [Chitinophagales bacterium]